MRSFGHWHRHLTATLHASISLMVALLVAIRSADSSTGLSIRAIAPAPANPQVYAHALSPAGDAIVGMGLGISPAGSWVPFLYMGGSYTKITPIPGATSLTPMGVSDRGAMVVGSGTLSATGLARAVRWTPTTGATLIPCQLAGHTVIQSAAVDVSADGRIAAGSALFVSSAGSLVWRAFVHTIEVPTALLLPHPAGISQSRALAVSHDGSTLAGNGTWRGLPRAWIVQGLPVQDAWKSADFNADGEVDFADLLVLLAAWGPCALPECPTDLNGDGATEFMDLLVLLSVWG